MKNTHIIVVPGINSCKEISIRYSYLRVGRDVQELVVNLDRNMDVIVADSENDVKN